MPPPIRASDVTRAQLTSWRNALFVVFGLCGMGLASWAARIPTVSTALDLRTDQVGVLLFGLAIGSILGLIASGHLVAHFGSRAVIVCTLVIAPIGMATAGFGATAAQSFAIAFVGLAIYGAGMGACDVAMNVSGAANERAIGRTIMPIYHAAFSFGTMLGAGLAALAELAGIPLHVHLGVLAIVMVCAAFTVVRLLQPETAAGVGADGADETAEPVGSWRERLGIWRDPRTLLIGLIVLGMAFAEGSANDWLSYAMVEGHDTTESTGALVFGVFVTAMTVGRLAGVRLLDRFGRVPVLRVSAVFAAVGLLTLILVPVTWIAVVGVVLWGLGASLGFPVGMSAAADDPRTAAARVSAVATIGYIAFLVGPPAIGFIGEQVGILNALLVVLILVAAAGAVSSAARERTPIERH
ncbi:MFS transporter [Marisediminicola senii]|uniref:MFS transporter n=1 Tax=Marisediminicola senii TaxID=2711233 RepID=UPI0013EA8EA4|nr:MFS transporter [Marisediminicola senii]